MKGLEQFTDLIAMAIGMAGALVKGMKKKLKFQSIILGMVIAGILSFSLIGVVEIFYKDLSPKVIILISFIVGWVANELTEKIDEVFEEFYQIAYEKIKKLLKK